MKPVVLRFALRFRWLIPALWGWGLFVAYFFGLVETQPWTKLLRNPFDWALFVLLGLSFYTWIFIWNYKVVFGNTHLIVKTLWFPFFKPFSCDYEDIRWVMRGGSQYSVKIVLKNEQVLTLATRTLEGGEEKVIAELKARIKAEKIMSDVEVLPSWWGYPGYDRRQIFIVGLITVLMFLYWQFFIILPDNLLGWKTIPKSTPFSYIYEYSVDTDGAVWAVDGKASSDNAYNIRHITNGKTNSWKFLDPSDDYLLNVGGDKDDSPWIFKWYTTFHWENGQWVEVPYPIDLQRIEDNLKWEIFDGSFWVLLDESNNNSPGLFAWNLTNNESQIILLPAYKSVDFSERLRRNSDGSLLLLRAYNKDIRTIEIFQLKDQNWEYLISFRAPENADLSNVGYIDATIDASGQFWFFVPLEDHGGYFIYRLNAQSNQWESTELTNTLGAEFIELYRFDVDSFGRIWVGSYNALRAFAPNWGHEAEQLVYYTRENSGAIIGGYNMVYADGKIWASYEPIWINANAEKLPRPFPDGWDYSGLKFGVEMAGLIAIFLFQYVSLYILRRRAQRENAAKTAQPTA